jgi:hypothetical protein
MPIASVMPRKRNSAITDTCVTEVPAIAPASARERDSQLASVGVEEVDGLTDKFAMILKDTAMTGVGKDAEPGVR